MSVLEISHLGCHIATYRGFITLSVKGEEIQRVPFEHISSIITKAHGITYTQNALVKLAKYNIPVVVTDKAFMPVSMILPIGVHHACAKHLAAQVEVKMSNKKLMWKKIIQSKIKWQVAVLDKLNIHHNLKQLIELVNSGDTRNVEAQAARNYWQLLFGDKFIRDRYGLIPNNMLNYGYTIFRSELARQICATGLHPALGIHHKHRENTFCLVDDLIEPFRPIVDYKVYCLTERGESELTKEVKKELVFLLEKSILVNGKWLMVSDAMKLLAQSLSKSYLNNECKLKLPKANLTKI